MIKIVNRGFITVRPKKAFLDWANQFDDELQFSENDDCEASIYLIEEEFWEADLILEKYFKKIFENELLAITDEDDFPENRTIELFLTWFDIDFGSTVFDTQKTDLLAETID